MNIERFMYMFKEASDSLYETSMDWQVLCSAHFRGKLSYTIWMEEVFELISAIEGDSEYGWYKRLEEMADVLICIRQIKKLAGYSGKCEHEIKYAGDIVKSLSLFGQEISKFSRGMRTFEQIAEGADHIEHKIICYAKCNKYSIYDLHKAMNAKQERFVCRYGTDALGDFIAEKKHISEDVDYHFKELRELWIQSEVVY